MTRLVYLLLFFTFSSAILLAQEAALSGVVTDTNEGPIPFCNVVLMDLSSVILSGTITEDDGSFIFDSLEEGSYIVKVSYVGYEDFVSDTITLSRKLNLPTIQLIESRETLGEVTVTARKPIVTRKADRLVFNVENSVLSNGSTMDILRRTPAVVVNQDKITVRNEGVTIYLNNRRLPLDEGEIQTLLESLGGDVIESIEVMQNPPADFDAEGGPVLNIITSKSVSVGYKGNISTRGTYSIFPKHSFGTSHFFKGEKIDVFVNYSFNPRKDSHRSLNDIVYRDRGETTIWDQDYERKARTKAHNANISIDYQATDRTTLSFAGVGLFSPNELNTVLSLTDVASNTASDFDIKTVSRLGSERTNIALDARINHNLKNGSLSGNVHFTTFNRDRSQNLTSRYRDEMNTLFRTVRFNSLANQDIEIYTGQLDFSTAIGKLNFQTGVKTSIINSQSVIDFPLIQDSGTTGLNAALNDDFLYDENVFAGYVSLGQEWEKWSAKAGLRAEQTNSKGTSLVLNTINELDYLEFFPTAYLQYAPSDTHNFSFDYARRIDRPRYQDLNPFSYFLNENNFDQGNANLLPAFSNRFNFNYTYNGKYSFDVYYRDNGENIVILPFQDNQNQVLRTVRQNALDSKSWGIDFNHDRAITSWLYFVTYLSAFHEEETFVAVESGGVEATNAINGFYVYIANYLNLSKDRSFTANVSFEYLSSFLLGSYIQDATTSINFGLKKMFWNDRAAFTLNVNDILNRANGRLTSRYLNQNNGYRVFNETQNLQVGFAYKFGNFRLSDNEKSIDKTERDRLEIKD
jgi:hypothetical protein